MRGGIRPPFLDSEGMRSKRVTKAMVADQVMLLQAYIDEKETLDKAVESADSYRWYGVAYVGWGTWEEDVFIVEALSPEAAIGNFERDIRDGHWEGHGALNPQDRHLFGQEDQILVYAMTEIGTYQRRAWEKV